MAYGRNGRGRDRGGRGGRRDFEQRDNSGAIFKNERKDSDKHPDMRGQVMVDGRMYWISAWWKEPRSGGADYLSIAVERQDEERRRSHDRDRRRDDSDDRGDRRDRRDRDDDRGERRSRSDDDDEDRERGGDERGGDRPKNYERSIDDEIPF